MAKFTFVLVLMALIAMNAVQASPRQDPTSPDQVHVVGSPDQVQVADNGHEVNVVDNNGGPQPRGGQQ